MFLRHITLKKNLNSIYNEGMLDGDKSARKNSRDTGYISFELDPTSDILVKIFHVLKGVVAEEVFELVFDGNKIQSDGIKIESISGYSKKEISLYNLSQYGITNEDFATIGEYRFIKGQLSIEYLTDEARERLESYIKAAHNS